MSLALSKYGGVTINETTSTTTPRPCVYELQSEWMTIMSKEVNKHFIGNCVPIAVSKCQILVHDETWCENWWLSGLWNNGSATLESITQQFNNVASSVTNHMRIVGWDWKAKDDSFNKPTAEDLRVGTGTPERTGLCMRLNNE